MSTNVKLWTLLAQRASPKKFNSIFGGQSIHRIEEGKKNFLDRLLHLKDGRNQRELKMYATDKS